MEHDQRFKVLLFDCVEAYLPLEGTQKGAFERLLEQERYQIINPVGLTSRDQGILIGQEQMLPRLRTQLLRLVRVRFGAVPADVEDAVSIQANPDTLDRGSEAAEVATDLAASRASLGLPNS